MTKGRVLITGASSGLGLELTKLFAKDGYDLILVARNVVKLEQVKTELELAYKIDIIVLDKDLSLKNSCIEIYDELKNRNIAVDILVNNAGLGSFGLFHETELSKLLEITAVNIDALTILTRLFCKDMAKRKNGKILNIASIGAFQGSAFIAAYYASKAYVLSLSEAIANELKDYGVSVTVFCPGPIKTNFHKAAGKGMSNTAIRAEKAASLAYSALRGGKTVVIPGAGLKMMIFGARFLPRRGIVYLAGKLQKIQKQKKG